MRGKDVHPLTACDKATSKVLREWTWFQRKGCLKKAFLSLYEEGIV
ncbi:DUF6979 family protein [Paenibacillus paridis]